MKRKTIKYSAATIFLCGLVLFFIFVNKPYYFENEPYQFLEVNNNFSENATGRNQLNNDILPYHQKGTARSREDFIAANGNNVDLFGETGLQAITDEARNLGIVTIKDLPHGIEYTTKAESGRSAGLYYATTPLTGYYSVGPRTMQIDQGSDYEQYIHLTGNRYYIASFLGW